MSFSDMMQSSRGPGVIGMLLAMVVLIGFGVLFLLAFNEEPPREKITIEAVIKEQAAELEEIAATTARKQQDLAVIPKREAAQLKLRSVNRELSDAQGRIDSVKAGNATATEELAGKAAEFEQYKDRYRAAVRLAAKDEEIANLQTRSGQTYEKVVVREVTPIGMQIRHQGGFARIPFEELPADLQQRFQFDPKQKAEAFAAENAVRKEHDTAVATTLTATKEQNEARKQADAAARQAEVKRTISLKTSQITALDSEIAKLQAALQQEQHKKFKRTQPLVAQIAEKQAQRNQLQAELAQLRASL